MNERKDKVCRKHETEGQFVEGYCIKCYPFPRVYCIGCGQPLTSAKHRARREGARCYQGRIKKERQRHMKEEVPYVDTDYYRKGFANLTDDLGDLF